MPSRFAEQFRGKQHLLDEAFGETLRLIPWLGGELSAGGPDPSRAERDLVGIVDDDAGHDKERLEHQRADGDSVGLGEFGFDQIVGAVFVDFPLSAYASEADWPRPGDRIERLGEAGEPRFEVVARKSDHVSRLIVQMVRSPK
jgi:hypothetical protein